MKFWVLQSYRSFAGHDTPKLKRGEDGKVLAFSSMELAYAYKRDHFPSRLTSSGPFVQMREGKLTAKYRLVI